MFSIKQISFFEAVKAQLQYKLRAYHSMIGTMIIFQMIALLFSFSGQFSSMQMNNIFVETTVTSADTIISFTLLWAFIMSIYLTVKASKNMMFTFVTDKKTNHVANILFMVILSVIGGITAILLGFFLKLVILLINGVEYFIYVDPVTIKGLFISITATILYLLLVFSIGYVIGEVIQLHRLFVFFVPLVLFGLLISGINLMGEPYFIIFYIFESNFFIFACKVLATSAVLFIIASLVGRGLEVRR